MGNSSAMVAGIAIGCAAVAVIVFILLFVVCWKKTMRRTRSEFDAGKDSDPSPSPLEIPYPNSRASSGFSTPDSEVPFLGLPPAVPLQPTSTFTYDELERATDGFSEANLLGQGGFGYVHKGVLPDGTAVAVKQLKPGSGQGEREFRAEVEIISRISHKHLVSLVGYCLMESWRMLVYEFVPNNNLEFHLHGKGRPVMDWSTRLKIAHGAAKGLAYLHEECNPKIIHRDIKASNILLDLDFEAKVADFGLAKLFDTELTHVSTRVMGTFGYLAPEYAFSGKLTEKSDVFSYGVLLLELITGRTPFQKNKASNTECLVDWAKPLLAQALEGGNFDDLVDQRVQNNQNRKEMVRMVTCAAACVFDSAKQRPKMSQVVRALEGESSIVFNAGKELSQQRSKAYSSYAGSSGYDTAQYNQDMAKFRKMALETEQLGSSISRHESSSEGQPRRSEMELTGKDKQAGN